MSAFLTIFAWMIATVAWIMLTAPAGDAQLAATKANRGDDFWNGNSADTAPPVERWRSMAVGHDQVQPNWKARGSMRRCRSC